MLYVFYPNENSSYAPVKGRSLGHVVITDEKGERLSRNINLKQLL